MEYVKLGNTGLDVSKICLGCMGFGDPERWVHKWVLNEEESMKVLKHALDVGINFFDTANVYSLGASEEILGKAIKEYANRDEIVVATKAYFGTSDKLNQKGLSKKAIHNQVNDSLERLNMDYIDLLIIHRWDYNTPIEETMIALDELVKAGKVRYIGASAMYTWQFQKAQNVAEKLGLTKFISMQNHMNLIYREDERELLPFCKDSGVAITPYSPLASGRLTRDLGTASSKRAETDDIQKAKYGSYEHVDNEIITRVAKLAEQKNVTRAQIAIAWLLHKDLCTVPIIGATKISHIDEILPALDITLTAEEIEYLEECYVPHHVIGAL